MIYFVGIFDHLVDTFSSFFSAGQSLVGIFSQLVYWLSAASICFLVVNSIYWLVSLLVVC